MPLSASKRVWVSTRADRGLIRIPPFVLAFVLLLASCASEQSELPRQEPKPVEIRSDGTIANFYKRYTGTVAGQNVTVHLVMSGNVLTGSYYYDKHGIPITLWGGEYDARSRSYTMSEEDRYGEGSRWLVGFEGLRLLGTWSDKNRTHKIELTESGGTDFGVVSHRDSLYARSSLAAKGEDVAMARYDLQALTPGNSMTNDDANDFMRFELRMLGLDTNAQLEAAYARDRDRWFSEYRDAVKDESDKELRESFSTWTYETSSQVMPVYDQDGLVVLRDMGYLYTGGAHGIGGPSYHNYDFKYKRQWQLGDILMLDTSLIVRLLEAKVREEFKIAPESPLGEELLTDSLSISDNFYFTNKGIAFVYLPYEIAAYAYGTIELFIPYDKLTLLLKPDFISRMRLSTQPAP